MSEEPAKSLLQRLGVVLYWVFPAVPFLWLYHRGLWCWFFGDDFSLLLLAAFPDKEFWEAFFQPRAQGTFRPLSERLFFYFFYGWFGFDAFPYRVLVFATQIVNLWLLVAVTNRLTRNRLAGLVAASLWGVHHGLASSMTWTSAYNQVLCAFFLLLSFLLFLRFAESGRKRYYAAQWITFALGLGSLETMVVYPVVLLAYALIADRRLWLHSAAMLPGSIAFAWLQLSAAPTASEGIYQTDFGLASLAGGFWHYTQRALVADELAGIAIAMAVAAVALAAFQAWRGVALGVFLLAWFAITLGPYLPLPDHRLDYYLVLPSMGIAMLAGWAVSLAFSKGGWLALALARKSAAEDNKPQTPADGGGSRPAATIFATVPALNVFRVSVVLFVGAYIFASAGRAKREVSYFQPLSLAVKQLLSDASRVRAEHPRKTILLANVPEMVFYLSMAHDAFRAVGVYDVYLTPDNQISRRADYGHPIDKYFLPASETLLALERERALVYDASGPRLVDVTPQYSKLAPLKLKGAP